MLCPKCNIRAVCIVFRNKKLDPPEIKITFVRTMCALNSKAPQYNQLCTFAVGKLPLFEY